MRAKVIIAIVLAGVTASVAAAQAPTKPRPEGKKAEGKKAETSAAEKFFQKGRDALLTGDYTKAMDLLAKAVAADKTKSSYRLALAQACRYAGKTAQAETHLAAILKAAPDHVEARQLLAEIYSARKAWKDVVKALEPLLKYRHDYTTYHLLAQAKQKLGDAEKARKYYEQAVKLNPSSAADHYELGNIYLAGNFYALSASAYEKALALGIDSPVLRYKLASAYFNLRNYFGRISVVTVKAGKAGHLSGNWYLIEPVPGKKDVFRAAPSRSAIYQVARAIADGIKDRPDIHFLKANIYLNARRYKTAYAMFTKIRERIPKEDQALFYHYYSGAAFGIGKYDEYLKLLEEAIKRDKATYEPLRVEAFLKVAEQHNQAGQLDKYILYLTKAVAASPQTAALHLRLGYAYEEARKYDLAVVQWRMVLDLEPDHPQRMKLTNLITKHRARAEPSGT